MQHRTLALLMIATVLPLAGVPGSHGADTQIDRDLTEVVPAGEYRAYLVRLTEPGQVQFGGRYLGPTTTQPVLPILASLDAVDGGASTGALFAYDFSIYREDLGVEALVQTLVGGEHIAGHEPGGTLGGGWSTGTVPAGDYRIVVASAPADGQAELRIRVPSNAQILASDQGESYFDRGLDQSLVGYDLHLWAANPNGPGPGALVRSWYYSGAELPIAVDGLLYGFIGYKFPTGAQWVDPDGQQIPYFVVGGASGEWTASFPEERFTGPVCAAGSCQPQFGDSREDPPFVIAVDVDL